MSGFLDPVDNSLIDFSTGEINELGRMMLELQETIALDRYRNELERRRFTQDVRDRNRARVRDLEPDRYKYDPHRVATPSVAVTAGDWVSSLPTAQPTLLTLNYDPRMGTLSEWKRYQNAAQQDSADLSPEDKVFLECMRRRRMKAAERRHHIIKTGHGGHNGVSEYKPREEC